MLVESLEEIVNQFNEIIPIETPLKGKWNFNYGKDHWQNKGDYPNDEELPFAERQKYLLLLWKDRTFTVNKHGAVTGYTYDGEMVLLVRSKISDPTYDYKYKTHIKKLEAETERLFNAIPDCEGWTIKSWKESEVSNIYDANMDGLRIRFSFEYE